MPTDGVLTDLSPSFLSHSNDLDARETFSKPVMLVFFGSQSFGHLSSYPAFSSWGPCSRKGESSDSREPSVF